MKTASKRKSAARTIQRRKPRPQSIVKVPTLPEHRYDLDGDQVALIKRTIAKGATDDELQLFLWVAKRHRLDPFTRQLHLVKRFDTALNREVATIQVGIDGYRQMASRYPDFGSVSEAEYGAMKKDGAVSVPDFARIRVFKKGLAEPTVGVAFWDEYAPNLTDKKAFMWRKMPRHMLAKCAEAIALRKAYPDLADIYTDEEMARTNSEHTPSGRQIVEVLPPSAPTPAEIEAHDAQNPYLKAFEERAAGVEVSLFWVHHPENGNYEIMGADSLKTENRDLLKPLYSKVANAIMATPEQLGKLISQFENRKVPFKELGAQRQPGE